MNEYDKIIRKMSDVMNWMRSAKENEDIRAEMYSAAEKTCRDLAEQIGQMKNSENN